MVTVNECTGEPLFGAALMLTVLVPELKLQESVEEMEVVVELRLRDRVGGCTRRMARSRSSLLFH